MFRNSRPICESVQPCPGQGTRVSHPHIPERSVFPSAVRGAGAERFGLPSGVRGTSGVG